MIILDRLELHIGAELCLIWPLSVYVCVCAPEIETEEEERDAVNSLHPPPPPPPR